MKIAVLFALFCYARLVSGAMHSLKYFYTASSGIPGFPDFVAVGMVDEVEFIHYDGKSQQAVFKQDWMKAANADDPQYLQGQTQGLQGTQQSFKVNIGIAKERFNQTADVHTYQLMYGCQYDDEGGPSSAFKQYAYDGEDLISLEMTNMRWTAAKTEVVISQNKWNADTGGLEYYRNYYHKECIDWLKKYLKYGSSTLERKDSPEVSLVPKGSGVACHATGFYPDSVMIAWKKNGVEMEDDMDVGETLPNEDGTFQKRAVLTVSPEERKKAQYSCEVTHKSGAPIVMVFEEGGEGNNLPVIIGCLAAAVVLVGVVVAVVMMKKKGYTKASQSDTSSDNSAEPTKA